MGKTLQYFFVLASLLVSAEVTWGQSPYAGYYSGTYSGGESGTWQGVVDISGIATGSYIDSLGGSHFGVGTVSAEGGWLLGFANPQVTFQGQINATGHIAGTWTNSSTVFSGVFSGTRGSQPPEIYIFTYITNSGTIKITGYTGPGGAVTIPSIINGRSVTQIGFWPLFANSNLTSVTIGSSVTNIEVRTFAGCAALRAITVDTNNPVFGSVDGVLFNKQQAALIQYPRGKVGEYYSISNNITSIMGYAFAGCTNLTNVTISANVTNIGDRAFYYCRGLTAITVAALNPSFRSMDGVLFNKNQTALIQYPLGQVGGEYTIPNSVTSIGDAAFSYSLGLTNLTILNNVTNIGGYAFNNCSNLTTVIIGDGVIRIGDWAFAGCTRLTGVYFQGYPPSLGGSSVFSNATNTIVYQLWESPISGPMFGGRPTALWILPVVQNITYLVNNGTVTIMGYTGSGGDVTIPSLINGLPVTSIRFSAFAWCSGLTNITIGDSVTNIRAEAFYNCYDLAGVTIGTNVTSIGDQAFQNCTHLTNVTIGSSVTTIGDLAFASCSSLTSLTIPGTIASIGDSPFSHCSRLGRLYFKGNAPIVGDISVLFNDNPATLYRLSGTTGWEAWDAAYNAVQRVVLWNPTMPCGYVTNNGTVTITRYTGSGGSVIIPGTMDGLPVTRIQPSAFAECPSLTAAYFQGDAPSEDWLFFSDENMIVYYLPGTTGWESSFGGRPTELWKPQAQTIDANFGVRTNRFGFNITWANGMVVVVETCTNLAKATWIPVQTNTLSGGSAYFSDPQWKTNPSRFYRLRNL